MNLRIIGLVLVTLAVCRTAEAYQMDGSVHKLTATDAASLIDENRYVLVYGYVPQCEVCKPVDGFLQSLSARLDSLAGIKVGKVDIANNKDIQKILRATFLPYIALFVDGVQKAHDGEITEDAIYNWVGGLVYEKPNYTTIYTKSEYEDFSNSKLAAGMKLPKDDVKALRALEAFSMFYPDMAFYLFADEAADQLKEKYEFILARKFDDGEKTLSGDKMMELPVMQHFFELFKRPNVEELSESIVDEMHRIKKPTLFILDTGYRTIGVENLEKIAFEHRSRFFFVKSNLQEKNASIIMNLFEVKGDQLPLVGVVDFQGGYLRKFKTNDSSVSGLRTFLDDYYKGRLTQFFKGEPIPLTQPAVKKVVKDNFNEIVKDKDNHVMLGVFSEGCVYCKELHEAFDRAQKELRSTETDIVFAKLNIDKNDVYLGYNGLPAIFLYKKDDKSNPVEYALIRDWEVVLDWIEQQLDRMNIYAKPMPDQLKKDLPNEGVVNIDDMKAEDSQPEIEEEL